MGRVLQFQEITEVIWRGSLIIKPSNVLIIGKLDENFRMTCTFNNIENTLFTFNNCMGNSKNRQAANSKWIQNNSLTTGQMTVQMTADIKCFDCSPNRKQFVCGFEDNIIRIYDEESASEIGQLIRIENKTSITNYVLKSKNAIIALKYSSDGSFIASAQIIQLGRGIQTFSMVVWDVNSKKQAFPDLLGKSSIRNMVFSPNNQNLIQANQEGKILIWDWKNQSQIRHIQSSCNYSSIIQYSPDGQKIIYGHQIGITIHCLSCETIQVLQYNKHRPQLAEYTKDGRMIVSGGYIQPIRICKVSNLKLIASFNIKSYNELYKFAINPDYSVIAVLIFDIKLQLWDRSRNKIWRILNNVIGQFDMKFSHDSRFIQYLRRGPNLSRIPIHLGK